MVGKLDKLVNTGEQQRAHLLEQLGERDKETRQLREMMKDMLEVSH